MLHTDRTSALVVAARELDEAAFAKRYPTSFLLFPRPGEELMTTEVNLQTLHLPVESAVAVPRVGGALDDALLLEQGFILEPIAGRWPGELGLVVTIGRARGNDIALFDATVSKLHALFRKDEEGVVWLFDPGSRNGTFVGGAKLRVGTQHRLGEAELIQLGGVKVLYKGPVALHRFLRSIPTGAKPKAGRG